MKSRMKNLYRHVIENRKHEVKGWHDAYLKFYGEVDKIRKRIESGEGLSENDDKFLRQLLYERSNGIASRGQSTLSDDNFQLFIKNEDFMSALSELIRKPTKENYRKFSEAWSAQGKSNNPVLVNRVAAACTLEVSTTVDSGRFDQVFKWLKDEKIIPTYSGGQDWFSKNTFLMGVIKEEFEVELKEGKTDEFYLSQFVWALYENLFSPFSLKKQIVKYGAPGTGKTYLARQQTSLWFDIWKEEFAPDSSFTHASQIELVQFHPSFSYEDFIEGLRPELDSGVARLTLQNGIFKEFCRKAGKWEIDYQSLKEKPKGLSGKDKTFDEQDLLTIEDLIPYREHLRGEHWEHVFKVSDKTKLVSNAIPPFFFIIDEINRAELSRVFGELMYCLEYRGVQGSVKTQYANLNNASTGMLLTNQEYLFFIPTNVYLIGTMNTIDRSVESFDFALRRRFSWEEVAPDTGLLKYHLNEFCKSWINLADNLEELNKKIAAEPLLGSDYQIGHAYLMNLKYDKSLTATEVRERVWEDSIRPLLQEYLRGTGRESDLIGSQGEAGDLMKAFGIS